MWQKYNQKGFITAIILIIIALILLGYLNINVQNVVDGPVVQQNLTYAWHIILSVYDIIYSEWQKIINHLIT